MARTKSPIPHVSVFRRPGRKKWYAHVCCKEANVDYMRSICLDRDIAHEWAVKTSQEISRLRLGLVTHQELRRVHNATKPVFDLLDAFTESRRTPKRTAKEVQQVDSRCRRLLETMEATALADLTRERVALAVSALHDEGLSLQTCNEYLKSLKRFAKFLDRTAGVGNEIQWVEAYNAATGIVHPRRSPTYDEVERLLASTRKGVPYRWYGRDVEAEERELAYLLAATSGLRYSELRFLCPEHFQIGKLDAPLFSSEPLAPAVIVEAKRSKHRRRDCQPIRADVAERFKVFLRGKPNRKPIWDLPDKAYLMIQFDQAAAEPPIEYQTDDGFFDFHSLRHFYGTELGKRKHIAVVQALMRHSDIRLTQRYMHVTMHDEIGAIESLPALAGKPQRRRRRATGTDGQLLLFETGATPAEGTAGNLRLTADVTALSQTHLSGVEPETFGSVGPQCRGFVKQPKVSEIQRLCHQTGVL